MKSISQILRDHGLGGGSGTARDGDVLTGKTYTSDQGYRTGTMPYRTDEPQALSWVTYTPPGGNLRVYFKPPAGYYDGQLGAGGGWTSEGNVFVEMATLKTENIRAGQQIFGVAGSSNVVDTTDSNAPSWVLPTGYSAWVKGAKVDGYSPLITNNPRYVPTTQDQQIGWGHYNNGSGGGFVIAGDADLLPENIVQGKEVFGVTGATVGNGSQQFDASGNFTVPAGVTRLVVELWGGGGGGTAFMGNSWMTGGCGGGGGGYTAAFLDVIPGQVIAVTVGAGGQGGLASGTGADTVETANGKNGGASTFSTLAAWGGNGATFDPNTHAASIGYGASPATHEMTNALKVSTWKGGDGSLNYNGGIVGAGGGSGGSGGNGGNAVNATYNTQGQPGVGGGATGNLGGGASGGAPSGYAGGTPGGGGGGTVGAIGVDRWGGNGGPGRVIVHW